LGFETALGLARAGATVILSGRNAHKGAAAVERIRTAVPQARVSFEPVDLANLASVRTFCDTIRASHAHLDILVNNAGVMSPPHRQTTEEGFELQFGTNYLGHFALTLGLLPLLKKRAEDATPSRVVSLSSVAHRNGALHFDDLQFERRYLPWAAYRQSKLAMLMFALELQRRSDQYGWGLISMAAHPGFARTDLIHNGPGARCAFAILTTVFQPFVSQSAEDGALPILFAATSPHAVAGGYYGPNGFFELKGPPTSAKIMPQALDQAAAARLWDTSIELTGATLIAG
jgi:NAD(P)-dependent dehydrogenase (short-subunit alcohol dehydrogenase family)